MSLPHITYLLGTTPISPFSWAPPFFIYNISKEYSIAHPSATAIYIRLLIADLLTDCQLCIDSVESMHNVIRRMTLPHHCMKINPELYLSVHAQPTQVAYRVTIKYYQLYLFIRDVCEDIQMNPRYRLLK